MIMALPESLEELLYSPTPIILGINEVQMNLLILCTILLLMNLFV